MKTIWKFPLRVADQQTLSMPAGAQTLTVQMQFGVLCLWAVVDPNTPLREELDIRMHGTGHSFDDTGYTYLATFQMNAGQLIFHVFVAAAQ